MNRGWFDAKSGTFHAVDQYHGRFISQERNHPCSGHESRMVQIPEGEPSTVEVDIMDGAEFKAGPSTLKVDIVDSSM